MGDKVWLDDSAAAIVAKWRTRLGKGWEPSPSDVLRYLDAAVEEHARQAEERERTRRGVRVG